MVTLCSPSGSACYTCPQLRGSRAKTHNFLHTALKIFTLIFCCAFVNPPCSLSHFLEILAHAVLGYGSVPCLRSCSPRLRPFRRIPVRQGLGRGRAAARITGTGSLNWTSWPAWPAPRGLPRGRHAELAAGRARGLGALQSPLQADRGESNSHPASAARYAPSPAGRAWLWR